MADVFAFGVLLGMFGIAVAVVRPSLLGMGRVKAIFVMIGATFASFAVFAILSPPEEGRPPRQPSAAAPPAQPASPPPAARQAAPSPPPAPRGPETVRNSNSDVGPVVN